MMILLAILALGLVLAAVFGWYADSRDDDYSLGKVIRNPASRTR